MAILRHKHERCFTIIANDALQDASLSWKARGILAYLLSMPDDWQFRFSDLVKRAPEGQSALSSGIRELKQAGYLTIERIRNDDGEYEEATWTVSECPHVDCPHVENPHVDNQQLQSTHITKDPSNKGNDRASTSPTPPAVKVFRANAHRYPAKSWYDEIDQAVGEDEHSLQVWGDVVKAYVGNGWNPTNVRNMLKFYKQGRVPPAGGSSGGRQTFEDKVGVMREWVEDMEARDGL